MNQLDQLRRQTVVVADTGNFLQIARYAPRDVDPTLLAAFLAACPAHGMGREDLVRVRAERESMLPKPLSFLPATLASSEAVSMFGRLKDPKTGTVSRERLQVRLPTSVLCGWGLTGSGWADVVRRESVPGRLAQAQGHAGLALDYGGDVEV